MYGIPVVHDTAHHDAAFKLEGIVSHPLTAQHSNYAKLKIFRSHVIPE